MRNVAAGHSTACITTHGSRAGTHPGAARTDMRSLALFCAVAPAERRLVLDQFLETPPPGPGEVMTDLETVAGIMAVNVGA